MARFSFSLLLRFLYFLRFLLKQVFFFYRLLKQFKILVFFVYFFNILRLFVLYLYLLICYLENVAKKKLRNGTFFLKHPEHISLIGKENN